ncbi:MAG: CrcB family protein [Haloferacaceae archaeon]
MRRAVERLQTHSRALALVAVGGGLGATARWGVELAVPSALGATFAANVAGCLLLGVLVTAGRTGSLVSERQRLVFATGFCSSFTTYSTFVLDIVRTRPTLALAYLVGSYAAGFLAVGVGVTAVERSGVGREQPTPGTEREGRP